MKFKLILSILILSLAKSSFSAEFVCDSINEPAITTLEINKKITIAVCGYPYETTKDGIIKLSAAESSVIETLSGKEYIWTNWNESLEILKTKKELIIYFFRSLHALNSNSETEQLIYTYSFKSINNKLVFTKTFSYKTPIINKQDIENILINFNKIVANKEFNAYGAALPIQLMVAAINGSIKAKELLINFGKYVPLDGEIAHAYSQAFDLYKIIIENDKNT